MNIFVLGIGFDKDGSLSNRSLAVLGKLITYLMKNNSLQNKIIYFVGGVKNIANQTEADCMAVLFEKICDKYDLFKDVRIKKLYPTKSISESFKMIRKVIKDSEKNVVILPHKKTSLFFYERCSWLAEYGGILNKIHFVFAKPVSSLGSEATWRTRNDVVFAIWNFLWYIGIPVVYSLGLEKIFSPKKNHHV
ncbi:MAG: hypothetical protein PHO23_02030 [Candidatus Pacebacteria bacterium]|nr:hypothetical protein [Candidatus Paceibacterota bacterium]